MQDDKWLDRLSEEANYGRKYKKEHEKLEVKYKKLKKKYKKLKKFAKEVKELEDILEEDGYCSFVSNAEDLYKEYKKFLGKL